MLGEARIEGAKYPWFKGKAWNKSISQKEENIFEIFFLWLVHWYIVEDKIFLFSTTFHFSFLPLNFFFIQVAHN